MPTFATEIVMGVVEDIRKVIQDLVAPDLKAINARLDGIESTMNAEFDALNTKMDTKFELVVSKMEANHRASC